MVDIETATNEEIADQAVQILRLVREEKELKESTLRELIEWLVCYVLRLNNDLQGVPHKTEQEVEKEIRKWASGVSAVLSTNR